ncbi:Conserved_hypothetical protein [Hexamita inflata]|uniref:Uncharacterized protein n=1 Tax=Hexamita inflata TaxID=28002 RepID=A0AA86Q5E6_9EUKA|nr:Conserved hypothetical protein [Hexamita inflata]
MRAQLQQGMQRRLQNKQAQNNVQAQSSDENDIITNLSSFEEHNSVIPYLESQRRAASLSPEILNSRIPIPEYEQAGNGSKFQKLDSELEQLQCIYNSYQSHRENSSAPDANLKGTEIPTSTSIITNLSSISNSNSLLSLDQKFDLKNRYITSVSESMSIQNPNPQFKNAVQRSQVSHHSDYQFKNQPQPQQQEALKNIPPKPRESAQKPTKQQEKLIQELQAECERLQRQLKETEENTPRDQREQNLLIQKMKNEIILTRTSLEQQQNEFQKVQNELEQIIEEQNDQINQHKIIISEVNEIVTGQNKEFDFENLKIQLEEKFKNTDNDCPKEFYMKKIKEACEDLIVVREQLKTKDAEIEKLKNKDTSEKQATEIKQMKHQLEICQKELLQAQKENLTHQVINKSKENNQAPTNNNQYNSLKDEIIAKNQKIEKLNNELNELRTIAMSKQPGVDQSAFLMQQIKQLQEMNQLDKQKLIQQDEEFNRRYKSLSESDEQRIQSMRESYDQQIYKLKQKIQDLEDTESQWADEKKLLMTRFEKLKTQYEAEKFSELTKRLQNLEEVPQSKYINQAVERAILAETKLEEERKKFNKICEENSYKLQEYQNEIQQLLDDLACLM